MEYEFTHLVVQLREGESVVAEPGALVGHSPNVDIETTTSRDGLVSSAKWMLGGGVRQRVRGARLRGSRGRSPATPEHELDERNCAALPARFEAVDGFVGVRL